MCAPGTTMGADDRRAVPDGSRHTALAYGEVRVGPGEIAIGVESLALLSPGRRSLFTHAVAAAGVDPDDVLVVRVTEAMIEVDALDPEDAGWPVRTVRVDPSRGLARRPECAGGRAPSGQPALTP